MQQSLGSVKPSSVDVSLVGTHHSPNQHPWGCVGVLPLVVPSLGGVAVPIYKG